MWDGNRLDFNMLKVDFGRCAQIKNYIIQFKQDLFFLLLVRSIFLNSSYILKELLHLFICRLEIFYISNIYD
jgi:hypothetical protein